MIDEKEIEKRIKLLPHNLQQEVLTFIDLLLKKHNKPINEKKFLSYNWENILKEISDKLDSVELQHKAMQWR